MALCLCIAALRRNTLCVCYALYFSPSLPAAGLLQRCSQSGPHLTKCRGFSASRDGLSSLSF